MNLARVSRWLPGIWFCLLVPLSASGDRWLASVEPVISPEEKQVYLRLADDTARENFQGEFWAVRVLKAEEYFGRLSYVDETFGAGRLLSGTRTDQGRVYLSLGAPNRITRLPSSRILYPVEIWYYDAASVTGVPAAISLLFYRQNATGSYRLYSPAVDTIRALLNPQSSTRGMFPVNDLITESDVRQRLNLPPAEAEVIEAALRVAPGVTGTGNDEILARVLSPRTALDRRLKPLVASRVLAWGTSAAVSDFQSAGEDGSTTVDLELSVTARRVIGVEVRSGSQTIFHTRTQLDFSEPMAVRYRHRLHLLPGQYVLLFDVDGHPAPHPITVRPPKETAGLYVGELTNAERKSPFRFGMLNLTPSPTPVAALLQAKAQGVIQWRLRAGSRLVWSAISRPEDQLPGGWLEQALPPALPPGKYTLQATGTGMQREITFEVSEAASSGLVISYNANLAEEQVWNDIGRQHLLRGSLDAGVRCFERALAAGKSDQTLINLARVKALRGDLDGSRELVRPLLGRDPRHFEALSLMGYVEAKLQDYEIAVSYYRRALEVRRTPELEKALALTQQLQARGN